MRVISAATTEYKDQQNNYKNHTHWL
jgi:hypothetical protein